MRIHLLLTLSLAGTGLLAILPTVSADSCNIVYVPGQACVSVDASATWPTVCSQGSQGCTPVACVARECVEASGTVCAGADLTYFGGLPERCL